MSRDSVKYFSLLFASLIRAIPALIFCISFYPIYLLPQAREIKFDHITVESGLSQSTIYCMIQDRNGFLWIGTQDGLNRYDGYGFRVYNNEIDNPNSLSHQVVLSICEDTTGGGNILWIGTERGGINKFDVDKNIFTHYFLDDSVSTGLSLTTVPFIHVDKHGGVWAVTGNLNLLKLDKKKNKFKTYKHIPDDPSSISNNTVVAINIGPKLFFSFYETENGEIWISTHNGLNLYDRKKDGFRRYFFKKEKDNNISYAPILSVHQSPSEPGYLWLCSWGDGLIKLDKSTGAADYIKNDRGSQNSVSDNYTGVIFEDKNGLFWITEKSGIDRYDRRLGTLKHYSHIPGDEESLKNDIAIPFFEDAGSNIWMLSGSGGMDVLSRKSDRFLHLINDPANANSISSNHILSYFVDASNVIWIGTDGAGLNKYVEGKEPFRTYTPSPDKKYSLSGKMVRAITEDRYGTLWIGYAEDGLDRLDRATGTVVNYKFDQKNKNSLISNNVWAVLEGKSGEIWVGTFGGGLNKITFKDRKLFGPDKVTFKRYFHKGKSDHYRNYIRSMLQDDAGILWLGTEGGGLDRFDPKTEEFENFRSSENKSEAGPRISSNIVRSIYQSKTMPGILWLGTDGGLNKFDIKNGAFRKYSTMQNASNSISNNRVLCVYEDGSGIIWLGTYGGGLNRFDPVSESFKCYLDKDGLPNNTIYGILEDNNGSLWLSTNNGISKFVNATAGSEVSPQFVNYDVHDGLQSNEFNGGSYFKSRSGELFFGGIKGFNSLYPERIKINPYPPKVVLTDLKIFNRSIRNDTSDGSVLKKPLSETGEITLSHEQNFVSFEFVGLHYVEPLKNKYAFMLEGFDKNWRFTNSSRRFAEYTNLNPGEYVFKVRASNSNNVWSAKAASVRIIIKPPWWKTFWAYSGFTLIIIFGFFVAGKVQHDFIVKKERRDAQMREAELRAETAELQSRAAEAEAQALKAENERKTNELEEARKLQLSMLPEVIPELPNLEIAVYMKTASEVGGDYYDFSVTDDGTLIATVGDATGHGLKAGTMVSVIKGLFCANIRELNMNSFFKKITSTIKQMHLWNLYMGLTLVKIRGNILTAAVAGMPPIYIYRSSSGTVDEIKLKGMPLGAFDNFPYKEVSSELNAGDTVLIMSDGLPELFNENKDMFDYRRTKASFAGSGSGSPQEVIDGLIKSAENWNNGNLPNDDITLLVIKIIST